MVQPVVDEGPTESPRSVDLKPKTWSRRRLLRYGLGGAAVAVVAGATGEELISHGVLPGKQSLDRLEGQCSVPSTRFAFSPPGPSFSGRFFSQARNRTVGYTIAYPPGRGPGSALPLVVMLHGFGGNHATALSGVTAAQAVALRVDGHPLTPMAIATVDGGDRYWNPHPDDNPLAMVIEELLPLCQRQGLGVAPQKIGAMGISMGGYGALLLAEQYPHLIAAVAAISPAIWTDYAEAQHANVHAYATPETFHAYNAVSHAESLKGKPVLVASGNDDPFHPGVEALARALPPGAVVEFSQGCHTDAFFASQEPPSLSFLAQHLIG
jgi:pimeloyl-ACP methyl ester carboxylesterase